MTAKKYCDGCGVTHTSIMCFYKPRKRINQQGKQYQSWQDTRKLWVKQNPPDQWGFWSCSLMLDSKCLGRVDKDQLTVDHIIPRSHDPKLRYDLTNLQPACVHCNGLKGSQLK